MSDIRELTSQELMNNVKSKSKGKYGWPKDIGFVIDGDSIMISADDRILKGKKLRCLDPWALAFLIEAESRCGIKINAINFVISGKIDAIKQGGRLTPDLESFRRRVSFLSINNKGRRFKISIDGVNLELDDAETLFNRPANEIIRQSHDVRFQDNKPGRLEKDFQTWLCPKDNDVKSNVRLAVLGKDFFKLNKKGFGILREFPTGAFDNNTSKKPTQQSRILPTEFVDIVTLNKYGQLAVIELKLNDSKLEVIAQLVDYALFFRCYRDKLWPTLTEKLQKNLKSKDIICYVANNHFHDRFDNVVKYYTTNNSYGFGVRKVELGYSPEIG